MVTWPWTKNWSQVWSSVTDRVRFLPPRDLHGEAGGRVRASWLGGRWWSERGVTGSPGDARLTSWLLTTADRRISSWVAADALWSTAAAAVNTLPPSLDDCSAASDAATTCRETHPTAKRRYCIIVTGKKKIFRTRFPASEKERFVNISFSKFHLNSVA